MGMFEKVYFCKQEILLDLLSVLVYYYYVNLQNVEVCKSTQ